MLAAFPVNIAPASKATYAAVGGLTCRGAGATPS